MIKVSLGFFLWGKLGLLSRTLIVLGIFFIFGFTFNSGDISTYKMQYIAFFFHLKFLNMIMGSQENWKRKKKSQHTLQHSSLFIILLIYCYSCTWCIWLNNFRVFISHITLNFQLFQLLVNLFISCYVFAFIICYLDYLHMWSQDILLFLIGNKFSCIFQNWNTYLNWNVHGQDKQQHLIFNGEQVTI